MESYDNRMFFAQIRTEYTRFLKFARRLLNINSSSACIERFFSLCRIIFKSKSTNMKAPTTIPGSLLTENLEILEQLDKPK